MTSTARSVSRPRSDLAFFQLNSPLRPFEWLLEWIFRLPWKRLIFWASVFGNFSDFLEWKKMIDLDYSLELHQVNCEEYYWPGSEQRIIPCILFLANTRDRKLYAENVSTLSQMYKSLGKKNKDWKKLIAFRMLLLENWLCLPAMDESTPCIWVLIHHLWWAR